MSAKHCTRCDTTKSVDQFGKNKTKKDGMQGYCLECHRSRCKAYYQDNRDRLLAGHKARYRSDPEKYIAISRRWGENNKERFLESVERSSLRNPVKVKARKAVRNAVYRGKIAKPSECSECGKAGRIEGHHEDYSKPLDVIWLCTTCHGALHRACP